MLVQHESQHRGSIEVGLVRADDVPGVVDGQHHGVRQQVAILAGRLPRPIVALAPQDEQRGGYLAQGGPGIGDAILVSAGNDVGPEANPA